MGELKKTEERLRAGSFIGNYRVVRILGKGGMATVFEGVNEHIGKRVAIKVLQPQFSQNEEIERRFLNEARAVNLVRHPGLIDIYEFGRTQDGCTCIVMEFLDGAPLHVYLHRAGRLPLQRPLSLLQQVAAALAAVHGKGIVHRDVKPSNIIVVKDSAVAFGERAKMVDFGIAKMSTWLTGTEAEQQRTKTGILMGTPAYMAPEQCKDLGQATDRTDVYSLGVILFQALSGQLPFSGQPIPLMMKHIAEAPPSLRELDATLPGEVVALVHAMLAKEPGDRPAMTHVADELLRLSAIEYHLLVPQLHGEDPAPPPGQPSPGPAQPTTLSSSIVVLEGKGGAAPSRRRWRIAAACVLFLCLSAGATMVWLRQRPRSVAVPIPAPAPPPREEVRPVSRPEVAPEIKPATDMLLQPQQRPERGKGPPDRRPRHKQGGPKDISNDEVELLE